MVAILQPARSQGVRERFTLKTLDGHIGKMRGRHVFCLAFSPDGKLIASGGLASGTVQLWDAVTGQERGRLVGPSRGVTSIAFSPDGKTLASCDNGPFQIPAPGTQEGAHIWDIASGQDTVNFPGANDRFQCVAFS